MGGNTAAMRGDIELMGGSPQSPPLGKTLHLTDTYYYVNEGRIH